MRLKNEVLVGAAVVGGIVLLIVGGFWLAGRQWGQEQMDLVAAFREVGELREGNPVNYRGVRVGQVSDIRLAGLGDGVFVTLNVDADIELPPDVGVVVSPVSMFGDWQAQIVSVSSPQVRQLDFTVSTRPDVLPGAALPDLSQLTAVAARIADQVEVLAERVELAFTEETALKIRQAVGDVSEMTAQLTGFVDRQTVVYHDVSQNVLAATENINRATETVTRVAGELEEALQAGDVQRVISNVAVTSENLRQLSGELGGAVHGLPGLMERAETSLAAFSEVADDVGAFVRALEPQVNELGPTLAEARQAMTHLRQILEKVEEGEGSLARLLEDPGLYEETQAAILSLRRLMVDIQTNPSKYLRNLRIF